MPKRNWIIPSNTAVKIPIPRSADAQYMKIVGEKTTFSMSEMESMLCATAALSGNSVGRHI